MKNIINKIAILLVISIFMTSCSDEFLYETPRSSITENQYFQNEAQAIALTNASYSGISTKNGTYRYGYARDLGYIVDVPTDVARVITTRGPMETLTMDAKAEWNNGIWQTLYMAIGQANLAISRIPDMPIEPSFRKRLVGESKFIRALCYYHLVQIWGAVPLKITEDDVRRVDQPRDGIARIIDQIKKDLSDASTSLPKSYTGVDLGRATSGASKALWGKVLLLNEEFKEAEAMFKDVIDNYGYELVVPYADLFSVNYENNRESIFEIQFNVGINPQFFSDFYGSVGVPGSQIAFGGGYGVIRHHPEFVSLFDLNDARRRVNVIDSVPNTGKAIPQDLWGWGKYIDANNYTNIVSEGNNWYVVRYADVLLSYAEALFRNNKLPEAISYINQVRKRARMSNGSITPANYPTTLNVQEVKSALRLERKLELGGEGHAWYDSKRLGTLIADNARVGVTVTDPKYTWPIPSNESDANGEIDLIVE
jgi:starch-binding outer membrane protein, SusD/RagB family